MASVNCKAVLLGVVRLVGQLSNPSSSLGRVLEAVPGVPVARPAIPSTPEPCRLGNGVVQRTIVAALLAAERPMRLSEIRSAVEALLGQSV